ncbi:MAG: acetyl-CoA carboxylase biotin carboxylase subunit [candidate division Zixibacteria bacterium]|nr:acetyl-CoA carboxylase biotin carboxylase subunit [candidate division Zixibacteria bacterium]
MTKKITKILIANRGEIAVRVMRACRDLDITSVAVFSDCDQTAYHVRMADEAYNIGPPAATESYLNYGKIIEVAKRCGADAIHPGYGFLSENAEFAQRCIDEGLIFIGPKPETIRSLGDKLVARKMAQKANLPITPGAQLDEQKSVDVHKLAEEIGYPVLVKAAAGGGGKGMRVVQSSELLDEELESAAREAKSAFGDGRVYMEKYLIRPRHIEIQILCDQHGNAIHLCERECSIQRRHQKVIEESPSPLMTPELREKMGSAAVSIALESGYIGAGTVEFLVDEDRSFYFLEVNTRLQVEHPVTEMVTGTDLVKEQIAVAEGHELHLAQKDISQNGHAIECRIYAENPEEGFMPSTGTLKNYRIPSGPGVRVDSGVVIFNEIPIYYDPMIAKMIVWGQNREEAIARTKRALEEYRVSGVKTTIGFHRVVMDNPKFVSGNISTNFLPEEYPDNNFTPLNDNLREKAAIAVALETFIRERKIDVRSNSEHKQSNWSAVHRRNNIKYFGGSC